MPPHAAGATHGHVTCDILPPAGAEGPSRQRHCQRRAGDTPLWCRTSPSSPLLSSSDKSTQLPITGTSASSYCQGAPGWEPLVYKLHDLTHNKEIFKTKRYHRPILKCLTKMTLSTLTTFENARRRRIITRPTENQYHSMSFAGLSGGSQGTQTLCSRPPAPPGLLKHGI